MNTLDYQPLLVPQNPGHTCRVCGEPLTQFHARVHMVTKHTDVPFTTVDGRIYVKVPASAA